MNEPIPVSVEILKIDNFSMRIQIKRGITTYTSFVFNLEETELLYDELRKYFGDL